MARTGPGWSTEANEIVDRLFVYGTFRAGEPARAMIDPHVESAEPAHTTGRLYALPQGYPGLNEDDTRTVVGEILYLRELAAAFALLDAYEGDEYRRVIKHVTRADGSSLHAWCYVLADPSLAGAGSVIETGDWCAWLRSHEAASR